MRSVDDFIEAAKAQLRLRSDRELSRALGAKGNPVTQWRCRRTWPSQETMRRLSEFAGVDEQEAMMDLMRWSAATPEVRAVWDRIAAKVAGAIAAIVICIGAGSSLSQIIFHNIHYAMFA